MATQREEEVRAMFEQKFTPRDISAELQISLPYVYKILKDLGLEPSGKPGPTSRLDLYDEQQQKEILQDYSTRRGTILEVLQKWDLSYNDIYRLLRINGVQAHAPEIVDRRLARRDRLDHAMRMYVDGAPLWQIIDETGISQPEVHREVRRRGLPMRRPTRGMLSGDVREVYDRVDPEAVLDDPSPTVGTPLDPVAPPRAGGPDTDPLGRLRE